MDSRAPSILKATLIGGVVFGVLGGIPIVNCLCCALMVGAGFLAAFLYSKECASASVEFKGGNGALVGLVASLFYAFASSVIGGIFSALMPSDPEQAMEMMEQFGMPPESMEMAAKFLEGSTGFIGILLGFFITLLIAALFSTIGGLIGGAVFKVEPPPAPPAAQTPSPGGMPTE